ncbi:MAG: four helix bundle protein [Patescibacteria group bacterium]|jgi:four helix bundle protein
MIKTNTDLKSRSYKFSLDIISFIQNISNSKISLVLINQLLRSATSIGANIFEAKSSSSKRDFIKFFEISLKSANETEYWLNLFKDSRISSVKEVDILLDELVELSKMIAASLLTMKNKRN